MRDTGIEPARTATRPRLRGRLHLVGAVVVAGSAVALLPATAEPVLRVGLVVYVLGVTAMLTTSAVYHVGRWSPPVRRALKRADHSAIFLGVAGTYTPIVLATLDSWPRTVLLVAVWVGAGAGIAVRNVFLSAPSWATTVPYVALGWLGVLALPAIWARSTAVTVLVVAGGLAYTLGAVVYARRHPDPWPAIFGFHEVFHALTLVAIALHWVAIRLAVVL